MGHVRGPFAYKKMETEDPDERNHRRAQFLIYKVLERADAEARQSSTRANYFLGVRFCKLKVKIGKRLKRLRKRMFMMIWKARVAVYKQIMKQLRNLKTLPYIFM
ncbi:uncharacterized protein LOC116205953 [Punica granatum]|uniref:Uncharacterized protein n=2 Tax=Punica granatum TaxID=22663 RepID=A0A218XFF9_PUNGR|nr:uncharacterized protein LOC116205953 [Punica granatum]OWM83456.1 hypothetical protein CDL15_Pgr012937 [Punica granatum]PKI72301.1 hypothetical protein CRG98_007281 [Punica granatum]